MSETQLRTISDWGGDHRIDTWMLPMDTRKTDPVDMIRRYAEFIDDLRELTATFTTKEIPGFKKPAKPEYEGSLATLFCLRQVEQRGKRRQRYINPNYVHIGHHEEPIVDTDERLAFINRYADSPLASSEWLAANFGIAPSTVRTFMHRNGIDWEERIHATKLRVGRTLKTIAEWDNNDYSRFRLAQIFPRPESTVRYWIREAEANDDWEPPERPTDESWYKRHVGRPER